MNEWWLSAYVNLLAAGQSGSAAKAFVLTMIPSSQQTAAGVIIDANATDGATMAALAFTARVPAAGWTYLTSSPMQTYQHT
jgi:hypothetical protein